MLSWIVRSWFLLALAVVLTLGVLFGHSGSSAAIELYLWCVQPSITTAIVLFLMAFSLDSSRRREALLRPTASVWGCVVNLGLVPLIAWPLAVAQSLPDFEWGLCITAATPCTLATASVFTRRAGGNDAVSLMTTLVTNLACVVITPLWLGAYFGLATGFDAWQLVRQLAVCVVLPTVLGQAAQIPAVAQAIIRRQRARISTIAQFFVLLLVSVAATNAGRVLARQSTWPSLSASLLMVAGCILLHVAAVAIGWYGGQGLRLTRADRIAVAIAGSQKTLPVGLMIVTSPELTGAAAPFLTFPLVVYHAVQLLIDAWLAERWGRECGS